MVTYLINKVSVEVSIMQTGNEQLGGLGCCAKGRITLQNKFLFV
jgi:hypothetical protein